MSPDESDTRHTIQSGCNHFQLLGGIKRQPQNQHTLSWPPNAYSYLCTYLGSSLPPTTFQLLFLFCLSNGSSFSNRQINLGIVSLTCYPSILHICLSTLHRRKLKLLSDFFLKHFLPSIHNKDNSKVQITVSV